MEDGVEHERSSKSTSSEPSTPACLSSPMLIKGVSNNLETRERERLEEMFTVEISQRLRWEELWLKNHKKIMELQAAIIARGNGVHKQELNKITYLATYGSHSMENGPISIGKMGDYSKGTVSALSKLKHETLSNSSLRDLFKTLDKDERIIGSEFEVSSATLSILKNLDSKITKELETKKWIESVEEQRNEITDSPKMADPQELEFSRLFLRHSSNTEEPEGHSELDSYIRGHQRKHSGCSDDSLPFGPSSSTSSFSQTTKDPKRLSSELPRSSSGDDTALFSEDKRWSDGEEDAVADGAKLFSPIRQRY